MFFYKEGSQIVRKFYLNERERESIVHMYHPEDDSLFFWFLKHDNLKVYFFAFHLVVWAIAIGTAVKKCRKKIKKLEDKERERLSEKEKRRKELERLLMKENPDIDQTEPRVRFR